MKQSPAKDRETGLFAVFFTLLLLAVSLAGAYYILQVKPLREAQASYKEALGDYDAVYADYSEAVAAYNGKAEECRTEAGALGEEIAGLEDMLSPEKTYSAAARTEAERGAASMRELLAYLPQNIEAEEKCGAFPDGEMEAYEYRDAVADVLKETKRLTSETVRIRENTENLEIPDYTAEYDRIRELKKALTDSVYDPFENLELHLEGIAPEGRVTLTKKTESGIAEHYTFTADRTVELKNGDIITVTVKSVSGQSDAAMAREIEDQYGVVFSSLVKTYEIKGLRYYVTESKDISDEMLRRMQDRGERLLKEYAEKNWGRDVTVGEKTWLGTYLLTLRSGESWVTTSKPQNKLYLLMRARAVIDLSSRGRDYKKEVEWVFAVCYDNVMVLTDGSTDVDFSTGRLVGDGMKVDTGVKSGLFSKYTYKFPGFADVDEARHEIVAEQDEEYRCENNVADVKE